MTLLGKALLTDYFFAVELVLAGVRGGVGGLCGGVWTIGRQPRSSRVLEFGRRCISFPDVTVSASRWC